MLVLMHQPLRFAFLCSATLVLATTGASKLWLVYSDSGTAISPLSSADPIVSFLSVRVMIILAALLEIGVVIAMFLPIPVAKKARLLLGIGYTFLVYRVVSQAIDPSAVCPCLGKLGMSWNWVVKHYDQVNTLLYVTLAYIICGSLLMMRRETSFLSQNPEMRCKRLP